MFSKTSVRLGSPVFIWLEDLSSYDPTNLANL